MLHSTHGSMPDFESDVWWPYNVDLPTTVEKAAKLYEARCEQVGSDVRTVMYESLEPVVFSGEFRIPTDPGLIGLDQPFDVLRVDVISAARRIMQRAACETEELKRAAYVHIANTCFWSAVSMRDALEGVHTEEGAEERDRVLTELAALEIIRGAIIATGDSIDEADNEVVGMIGSDHPARHETRSSNVYRIKIEELRTYVTALMQSPRPDSIECIFAKDEAELLDPDTVRELTSDVEERAEFIQFVKIMLDETDRVLQELHEQESIWQEKEGSVLPVEISLMRLNILKGLRDFIVTLQGAIPITAIIPEGYENIPRKRWQAIMNHEEKRGTMSRAAKERMSSEIDEFESLIQQFGSLEAAQKAMCSGLIVRSGKKQRLTKPKGKGRDEKKKERKNKKKQKRHSKKGKKK